MGENYSLCSQEKDFLLRVHVESLPKMFFLCLPYLLQSNELLQAAKINKNHDEKMAQLKEALKVSYLI